MKRRLYRAVVGGLMGTTIGVSAGLVTLHAATQPAEHSPAPTSVVVQQ